ncbi:uncharacterized protein LOC127626673 [Xyrauchen texanus]|uniref:uncharacterized protein LOC127626673 n=1 Tax=Xyrauchen texanus TaxID=154827 RepID=UPI002242844F|nr:uncharacterized protein LOC127626673 [Xyrauchen texanus]
MAEKTCCCWLRSLVGYTSIQNTTYAGATGWRVGLGHDFTHLAPYQANQASQRDKGRLRTVVRQRERAFPLNCFTLVLKTLEGGGIRHSGVLTATIHPNGAASTICQVTEEPGHLEEEEWLPTARGEGAHCRPPGAGEPLPGAGETPSVPRECSGAFYPPGAGGLPPISPGRHGCRPLEGGGVAEDQATPYRRTDSGMAGITCRQLGHKGTPSPRENQASQRDKDRLQTVVQQRESVYGQLSVLCVCLCLLVLVLY